MIEEHIKQCKVAKARTDCDETNKVGSEEKHKAKCKNKTCKGCGEEFTMNLFEYHVRNCSYMQRCDFCGEMIPKTKAEKHIAKCKEQAGVDSTSATIATTRV